MSETATPDPEQKQGPASPSPADGGPAAEEWFGGEVSIARGRPPGWMKWYNYVLWIIAIGYLIANPVPGYPILLAFAALMAAWMTFTFVKKRPTEP